MKYLNKTNLIIFFSMLFLFALTFESFARRGGGGRRGGHSISRSGPARAGSMRAGGVHHRQRASSYNRSNRQKNYGNRNIDRGNIQNRQVNKGDIQTRRKDNQGNRQDNRKNLQEDRQDWKDDNREDWQEYGDKARDERHELVENNWDEGEWGEGEHIGAFVAGAVIGTVITAAAFNSNNCASGVVYVDNFAYYQCSGSWYQQVYRGGDVTYIVVEAPPGY